MTERLYWQDAYLREWTAQVLDRREDERGPAVQLDRTAFYPEGGGQPADRGSINGVAVLDVQADEDDGIWHILAAPLEGDAAECALDWPRRFDHMQQHHGQHLLSAAFETTCAARTVAFHLGADSVTIDLDKPALTAERLAAVEDLANEVVWADLPILARFVTPDELAGIRLRKPPTVDGAIRVVSAGDFDHSACGGTHPRSTGGVGLIHIRRTERRGGGTRVEFVCGGRALGDLRWKNAALGRIAASFSGSPEQAEEAIERLREAESAARKALQEARSELLTLEARELVTGAPMIRNMAIIERVWTERDPAEIRALAQAVADAGGLALFGVRGPKAQLFFAGGEGEIDCGQLLRQSVAPFGGKGGGQIAQAQGGVPNPDDLASAIEHALAFLRA